MPFDLILKNVQSCLNQPLNLKNASPSSLYSLVQDVPFFFTSCWKGSIATYTFNFDTKALIIRSFIGDVTVVKIRFYRRFVDSWKRVSWKRILKNFLMIPIPLFAFMFSCFFIKKQAKVFLACCANNWHSIKWWKMIFISS